MAGRLAAVGAGVIWSGAAWWVTLAALAAGGGVYHGLRAWGGGPRSRGGAALARLAGRRADPLARLSAPGLGNPRGDEPTLASAAAAAPAGAGAGMAAVGRPGMAAARRPGMTAGGGLADWLGRAAGWVWDRLPQDLRTRLGRDHDLVSAGRGGGAREVVARALQGAGLGLVLAVAGLVVAGLSGSGARVPIAAASMLLPPLGLAWPIRGLGRAASARRARVLSALPDTLDLLVVGTAAGLNLAQALAVAARHASGALGQELERLQSELAAGRRLAEALGALAVRLDLWPVTLLAGALVQAESLGTPLAEVMRTQASAGRTWRRQAVEAHIGALPTRLTLVSIFLLMPPVFVVAVLPNVLAFVGGRW